MTDYERYAFNDDEWAELGRETSLAGLPLVRDDSYLVARDNPLSAYWVVAIADDGANSRVWRVITGLTNKHTADDDRVSTWLTAKRNGAVALDLAEWLTL
jgi:hypothetical protein